MVRDYFTHLNDNLTVQVKVLYANSSPVNLANSVVKVATSLEFDTGVIETLSSANTAQIEVIDIPNGIVNVKFLISSIKGYGVGTHRYQLQVEKDTKVTYQEGRLFIAPSLF